MNRRALARVVDRAGIVKLAMAVRRVAPSWLTVLTYHRVALAGFEPSATMLDEEVVDVAAAQLDRQLAFLKLWFHPIGIQDLLSFTQRGKPLPTNPILVTFDDGYRDNHDVALPILLRHGVRATFFIATEYVDRRRLFWWDRVALVLKRSPKQRLKLSYPERIDLPLEGDSPRRRCIRSVGRLIKDRADLDLERFIENLERAAGVALGRDEELRLADDTVMTWAQVVALRRAGMDVQSHTRTHRVLQTLSPAQVESELRDSRAALEAVLGEPVRAVAYPVGKRVAGMPHIERALRDVGYALGFTNGTGVNQLRRLDPLDVRRIALDIAYGDSLFRASLAFPFLGY